MHPRRASAVYLRSATLRNAIRVALFPLLPLSLLGTAVAQPITTPMPAEYAGSAAEQAAYAAGYTAALETARHILAAELPLETLMPPVVFLPATPAAVTPPAVQPEQTAVARAETPAEPPTPKTSETPMASVASVASETPEASSEAREPAEWWNHSSLAWPLQDQWRHNLKGQLSFVDLGGNDEGTNLRANAKLYSRLNRWTNELSLTVDKRNIASADGGVNKRDTRVLQDSLRYDLTDRWYTAGGFILERDDQSLIDRRITALLGVGRYWLSDERFRLNTYLALGQVDETYMDYVRNHVGVDSRDTGLLYFYQTFSWQISKDWGLRQGYRLMQDLDESGRYVLDPVNSLPPSAEFPQGFERYLEADRVKRYRSVAALDLDYRLGPRSTLSFGLEQRYDSNPWPGVIRRDNIRRMTFNFSF